MSRDAGSIPAASIRLRRGFGGLVCRIFSEGEEVRNLEAQRRSARGGTHSAIRADRDLGRFDFSTFPLLSFSALSLRQVWLRLALHVSPRCAVFFRNSEFIIRNSYVPRTRPPPSGSTHVYNLPPDRRTNLRQPVANRSHSAFEMSLGNQVRNIPSPERAKQRRHAAAPSGQILPQSVCGEMHFALSVQRRCPSG